MGMYEKKQISVWVKKALLNPSQFYKKTVKELDASGSVLVNLRGDDNKYNKWIIQELFDKSVYKNLLDGINSYEFENIHLSYNQDRIKKKNYFYKDKKSDKFKITEKRLAICFYNQQENRDFLGLRLHYETPIRFFKKDNAEKEIEIREGAIDLVYQTSEYINLIELKSDINNETLLRAILEICTYYKKLNQEQFYKNFNLFSNKKPFQLCLLLENTTGAYNDAKNLHEEYKKLLNAISEYLNCPIKIYGFMKNGPTPFAIDNNDGKPILKDTDFIIEEITHFPCN